MAITYHISKNHETEGKLMQLSVFSFVVLFLSFFFCFVFFALFFCFVCSVISNLNMCNFASSSKDTRSDFVQIAAPKSVFLLRCNAILYDFLRDHFRYLSTNCKKRTLVDVVIWNRLKGMLVRQRCSKW